MVASAYPDRVVRVRDNYFWTFLSLGNSAWSFVRVNVWSRDFWGFTERPKDTLGF